MTVVRNEPYPFDVLALKSKIRETWDGTGDQFKALFDRLSVELDTLSKLEDAERDAITNADQARRAVNTTQAVIDEMIQGLRWTAPQSSSWGRK